MQVDRKTWQQGPERADRVHGAAAGDQIVLANGIAGHNLDEPAGAVENSGHQVPRAGQGQPRPLPARGMRATMRWRNAGGVSQLN